MPVEFSVAAYRLGHSMVRPGYRLNDAILEAIFPVHRSTGTQFPEGLTGFRALITDWAIDWARFIDVEERDYGPNPDNTPEAHPEADPRNVRPVAVRLPDRHFARRSAGIAAPLGRADPALHWRCATCSAASSSVCRRAGDWRKMEIKPLDDEKILIGKAVDTPGKASRFRSRRSLAIPSRASARSGPTSSPRRCRTRHLDGYSGERRAGKVSTPQLGPVGGRIVAETFLALIHADRTIVRQPAPEWKPKARASACAS